MVGGTQTVPGAAPPRAKAMMPPPANCSGQWSNRLLGQVPGCISITILQTFMQECTANAPNMVLRRVGKGGHAPQSVEFPKLYAELCQGTRQIYARSRFVQGLHTWSGREVAEVGGMG